MVICISFTIISLLILAFTDKQESHETTTKKASHKTTTKKASKRKRKIKPISIWITFVFCFSVLVLASAITSSLQCKQSAEMVASFAVNNDDYVSVYYDSVKDEYFILDTNWWHPIKVFERKAINKETALKIINAVNIIEEAEQLIKD